MKTIRLYRFLNAHWGLTAIRERRLRIGRIEELNDDFEFIGIALDQKDDRVALKKLRKHIDEGNGILCMSRSWESPLMWAHYADSHKGVVLGFDVPVQAFYEVEYVEKRPTLASMQLDDFNELSEKDIERLTRMKAKGWSYEQEYRAFLRLTDGIDIDGKMHYFIPFNDNLRLREVIVGSRFQTSRSKVEASVADGSVDIFMTRGDFADFKVVRQHQESMWR